jgi:hypothetical protein
MNPLIPKPTKISIRAAPHKKQAFTQAQPAKPKKFVIPKQCNNQTPTPRYPFCVMPDFGKPTKSIQPPINPDKHYYLDLMNTYNYSGK